MKVSMKKTLIIVSVVVLVTGMLSVNAYAASPATGNSGETYYRTMSLAFQDINGGSMGRNALPEKGIGYANIKVVESRNSYDIYLLKSYTENDIISVQSNKPVNVYFSTYTLRTNSIAFDISYGNVSLYADGSGGISATGTSKARCAQVRSGSLTITGGLYEARATEGVAACVLSAGQLVVRNARLIAAYPNGQARCVSTVSDSANVSTVLYNCHLTAIARKGRAICFYNAAGCEATLRDCVVNAYSEYKHIGKTAYAYSSIGVDNYGCMTLHNCTVYGTHSGVQSAGMLTVNKGDYSGYGHGGFYITGVGNFARISKAKVSCKAMPSGYTATISSNNAALYVGGSGASNTRVYVNNSRFESTAQPIVMRGTEGETNNCLYISNSVLLKSKRIRIDANHRVYMGVGNNFGSYVATAPKQVVKTKCTYQ